MNKKPIILALALGGLLALPGATLVEAATSAEDPVKTALAAFADGYRASGSYTLYYDYPEGVAAVDYSTSGSFIRDFGFLAEEDGSLTRAVRDITSSGSVLHIEGKDGAAYTESLDRSNNVVSVREQEMLADILYSERYSDPFSYLVPADLLAQEDGTLLLNGTKAGYLLDAYFGVSFPCTGAELTLDSYGRVAEISFICLPREGGIDLTGTGSYLTIETTLAASVEFSYNVPALSHLEPLSYENPGLEAALEGMGDNYTILATSNYATSDAIVYRTASDIYVHLDAGRPYPVAGDLLYRERSGIYMCYVYDGSSFSMSGGLVQSASDFLPDFATVMSEQYREESEGTYVLDEAAVSFNSAVLMPEALVSDFDSDGLSAYVRLGADGKVSTIGCSYGIEALETSVTTSYGSYGTTTLPDWLDLASI